MFGSRPDKISQGNLPILLTRYRVTPTVTALELQGK